MKGLGKNKLLKIAIGIIVLVIVIVIALLIFHSITGGKTSYSDIENKVLKAAKKYYSENENLLPQSDNEQISIDDVSLTSLGYLDNMADLVKDKDGVTCSAQVIISYNNGTYRYTPLLDCGDAYKSQTFASYIENNVDRVYTGTGLYDLNGEYVYRGEDPNNYIKFSGHIYRIVKISDGKAVLILNEKYQRNVWDDRYNSVRDRNDGINDYSVSRVKDVLDEIYNGTDLISSDNKSLLAKHALYIGKRNETDNYNDGSIEMSEYLENQYIGMLPLYDYINASIDSGCNSSLTDSCSNYNYLNHYSYNWWTITADASNTYRVYRISVDGVMETARASSNGYIRPVIYLVDDALYVSGTGTIDDPYIVK